MGNIEKRRRDIDWDAISRDYRAGTLSLREMAQKHGCSHSTIANFAGRSGWSRDASTPARSVDVNRGGKVFGEARPADETDFARVWTDWSA